MCLIVVVSPLIALMHDQVANVKAYNHPTLSAAFLGGDEANTLASKKEVFDGKHNIVFITPERSRSIQTWPPMVRNRISLLVVDEAHCVVGDTYREHNRTALPSLSKNMMHVPLLSLTATMSPAVEAIYIKMMGRPDVEISRGDLDRPDILLDLRSKHTFPSDMARIQTLVNSAVQTPYDVNGRTERGACIVYVPGAMRPGRCMPN